MIAWDTAYDSELGVFVLFRYNTFRIDLGGNIGTDDIDEIIDLGANKFLDAWDHKCIFIQNIGQNGEPKVLSKQQAIRLAVSEIFEFFK
jgi:hypothetical protein